MSEQQPDAGQEERATVRIRRAPRFSAFIVVGALVGLIVTLILTSLFPADPAVGFAATFGYFALFGVPIGAVIGAFIAILLDRTATRRASEVVAGKLDVHVDQAEQSPGESPRELGSGDVDGSGQRDG